MSKEDIAFQEWARDFEGKLPEDLRENFRTITTHDAGKEMFRAVERREDYNRRVNEVQAEKKRLEKWFNDEAPKNAMLAAQNAEYQEKLLAYEQTLKELGLDQATPAGSASSKPSVAKREEIEDLRKELADFKQLVDRGLPKLVGDLFVVTQKTVKEGYSVDPRDVLSYAAERQLDPVTAFENLTAGERQKRAEAAQKALEEKWKEEGRREALSKLPSPTYIRPSGPSVIDSLNNKDFASDSRTRVNDAVKDFLEGEFVKGAGTGLV